MNALARITAAEPVWSLLYEFRSCAEDYAWFYRTGILEKAEAVDCAQRHAELWGAVETYGQDEVQAELALAFADEEPVIRAAEAIKANPQKSDRSIAKEIGASPTTVGKARAEVSTDGHLEERTGRDGKSYPAKQKPKQYRGVPKATVDAFWWVVRQDDADRLRRWLAGHLRDAAFLLKIWKERQC